jgi:hypothetical protein
MCGSRSRTYWSHSHPGGRSTTRAPRSNRRLLGSRCRSGRFPGRRLRIGVYHHVTSLLQEVADAGQLRIRVRPNQPREAIEQFTKYVLLAANNQIRRFDDNLAPVAGVGATPRVARAFQAVDDGGHAGGGQVQRVGQACRPDRSALAQQLDSAQVCSIDAETVSPELIELVDVHGQVAQRVQHGVDQRSVRPIA